ARLGYLAMVIVVLQSLLVFMLVKIIPVFEKILDDFEANVPALTQLVISISNSVAQSPFGILAMALEALIAGALFLAMLAHYLGWIHLSFPFMTRLDTSAVLRALSLVVER